jgi:hypothetical protein
VLPDTFPEALMLVAEAAPKVGVISIGLVAKTLFPVPVLVTETKFFEASVCTAELAESPVTLIEDAVAAPIFGVTSVALLDNTLLPVPVLGTLIKLSKESVATAELAVRPEKLADVPVIAPIVVAPNVLTPTVLVIPLLAVIRSPDVIVPVVVRLVKAPVFAVVAPIGPGLGNVFPEMELAFKCGTLVVLVTVNGGVPLITVLVIVDPEIFPEAVKLVALAAPKIGVTSVGLVAKTLLPDPVFVTETKLLEASVATAELAVRDEKLADVPVIAPIVVDPNVVVRTVLVNPLEAVINPPAVIVLVVVRVVKAPVLAVVPPIGPGLANVAPDNELAFKLATLVVLLTINGAVPVTTVLVKVLAVLFPELVRVVAEADPNVGLTNVGLLAKT